MSFLRKHVLTAPSPDRESVVTHIDPSRPIEAGMYDGGLIAIVDRTSSARLLRSWPQFASRFPVLFTTAFGDVFVFDEVRKHVLFINTQHGATTVIDPEVGWVLDEFIENPGVQADLLQVDKVKRLQRRHRDLSYHEAFILEPWIMFGGEDVDTNYSIGQCETYLDLVGQTVA